MKSSTFKLLYGDIPLNNKKPSAKPKRAAKNAALPKAQTKVRDCRRFLVVITSHRRRLLDEDNLCGKYHCDLLRYAGILPSDAPGQTQIQNRQIKVAKAEDECTEIEVTLLDGVL